MWYVMFPPLTDIKIPSHNGKVFFFLWRRRCYNESPTFDLKDPRESHQDDSLGLKDAFFQAWQSEFDLQDPHAERREQIPKVVCCLLPVGCGKLNTRILGAELNLLIPSGEWFFWFEREPRTLPYLFTYLFCFWDSVSLCNLDQASLEFTEIACLCLQSTGIKGVSYHSHPHPDWNLPF